MNVEDVLAILVDRHPRYSARWIDGVVRLREESLACATVLDDITVGPLTLDGDMLRLFMLLAWVAEGQSSPAPAGNINVTVGESDAAAVPATPRVLHVAVPADATLADALDLVVTTAGGGAWIVWEHPVGDSQVGCRMIGYASDGSTSAASSSDFKIVESPVGSRGPFPAVRSVARPRAV
jgi:hypothetical protein